jgi:uncharacterized protein YndB with AHSA1/START domain
VTEIVRERRIDAAPERVWTLVDVVTRLPEWFVVVAERSELLGGEGSAGGNELH